MRLLYRRNESEFGLTEHLAPEDIPPYAVLSHTWGPDVEEVTFSDLMNDTGKGKAGYDKIRFCGEKAASCGLEYFWVDTCCINKSSTAELQEAINSMFKWYRNAAKCFVYLSDMSIHDFNNHRSRLRASRWFTRGWTLQELIAPMSVEFFSKEGQRLGDKRSLERQIHKITGIPVPALRGNPLSNFSIEERMSWVANRNTKHIEDKAYCLLGVFGVYMPLIYGEGDNAFLRLQGEINRDLTNMKSTVVVQRNTQPSPKRHHHKPQQLGSWSYDLPQFPQSA